MDEQAIREAAVTAVADLQLDCEVREVRRSGDGDGWCVQFSGEFGQFCDEFATQFGEENSPPVMREKIKAHLLKQVSKIRGKTGKVRRPRADRGGADAGAGGNLFAAPLRALGEVVDNLSRAAGPVMGQAANVAGLASDLTADMAEGVGPGDNEQRVMPWPEAPHEPAEREQRELTTYAPAPGPKRAARSGAGKSAKKGRKAPAGGRKAAAKKTAARKKSRKAKKSRQ